MQAWYATVTEMEPKVIFEKEKMVFVSTWDDYIHRKEASNGSDALAAEFRTHSASMVKQIYDSWRQTKNKVCVMAH